MCTKGKLVGIYFGLICILRGWQNSGYQGQPFSPTPLPPPQPGPANSQRRSRRRSARDHTQRLSSWMNRTAERSWMWLKCQVWHKQIMCESRVVSCSFEKWRTLNFRTGEVSPACNVDRGKINAVFSCFLTAPIDPQGVLISQGEKAGSWSI